MPTQVCVCVCVRVCVCVCVCVSKCALGVLALKCHPKLYFSPTFSENFISSFLSCFPNILARSKRTLGCVLQHLGADVYLEAFTVATECSVDDMDRALRRVLE